MFVDFSFHWLDYTTHSAPLASLISTILTHTNDFLINSCGKLASATDAAATIRALLFFYKKQNNRSVKHGRLFTTYLVYKLTISLAMA